MIKTQVLTGSEPLDNILKGTETLYKAVSVTMGPRGHNVIFKKQGKKVAITHDGVTVARAVALNDVAEDAGAELLREAASKLDATTGDGTTTVTVLAYNILKEAAELIRQGGHPMKIKLDLDNAQKEVVEKIEALTDKDVDETKLIAVARVASGSKEIGEEVGKSMFNAGKDTPIVLDLSGSSETYTEVIDGFKINSGPASPYLLDGIRLDIENVKIAVCDIKLRDKDDVLPLLRIMSGFPPEERNLLLVCNDIAGDALSMLVVNHLKGFGRIAVARVPHSINSASEYLADIAISTGAKVLARNAGHSLSEAEVHHLGLAERVIIEPRETIIVNGRSIKEDLDHHIQGLEKLAKEGKEALIRKFADDRLKTLQQKIVSIRVGGQSETEAEEKHYRYEDAVGACRAALRNGVVPGGGTLLYSIAQEVSNPIIKKALEAPIRKVLENAGIDFEQYASEIKSGFGIDVMHPEDGVIDLVERGILDPSESEVECVKTAITIAGLLMTSGAMVVDERSEDEAEEDEAESEFSFS